MGAAHFAVHSTHALLSQCSAWPVCDGIANGDEAEPVNEGKGIGGGGADPIASNSIIF